MLWTASGTTLGRRWALLGLAGPAEWRRVEALPKLIFSTCDAIDGEGERREEKGFLFERRDEVNESAQAETSPGGRRCCRARWRLEERGRARWADQGGSCVGRAASTFHRRSRKRA